MRCWIRNAPRPSRRPTPRRRAAISAGPVTWEGFDDERVAALELPFTVIHAGTDAAMFAELDSAYQRKAPIMLWIYSPHWAPAKYEGEWVQFPEYTPECYNDPKWGVNPDAKYDCGKPHGEIWKYSWAGMKDKWPVAYKVAKNYTIDTDELNKMSGEVDLDEQVARRRRRRLDRRQRGDVEGLGAVRRSELEASEHLGCRPTSRASVADAARSRRSG